MLDHDVRWVADDDVVWEMLALAPATVVGTVTDTHVDGTETVDTIGIENSSDVPACDVRSEILCGPQGGEVLPSFWTDNALTLMPHEKREVTVRYRTVLMGGAEPHLMVEGFNVMPREIIVANGKQVPLSIKLIACESAALRNGNPTVKLTYVNAGTSGLRYTSWPIPVAVDGQVVRYAHVDCSGSKETSQTVSFGGLVPGEHRGERRASLTSPRHKARFRLGWRHSHRAYSRPRRSRPWPRARVSKAKSLIYLTAISRPIPSEKQVI